MRSRKPSPRALVGTAVAAALSLTLAACAGDSGSGGGEADGEVTIWTSMDQPIIDGLEASLAPKAEEAGIEVKWEKVTGIESLIMTKLNASDKPDIAVLPQPGVVRNVVTRDGAVPLDDILDMAALEKSMLPGVIEAGSVDDQYYGLQINANVKSLVFYPKKAWEKAGYPIPESLDDLSALTDQIKSDGGTPWCLGIRSEGSTGWPATDWFEDLVARFGGEEFYRDWVTNDEKFDSDVVRESAAWFEDNVLAEGNIPGGRGSAASVDFTVAGSPMFEAEPGCWMLKQGTFITGFFPENVQKNLDAEVGAFGFPPATEGGEPPVVRGGDLATLLTKDADTEKVMQWLSEPDIGDEAMKTGAYLSPHKEASPDQYPNAIMKTAAETAAAADTFLFDGSDQMPGEVGAGTFWSEITAWVGGNKDLDSALTTIDDSWPAS